MTARHVGFKTGVVVSMVMTKCLVTHNLTKENQVIERFSFECRKGIAFASTKQQDWLKKLAPFSLSNQR